MGETDFQTEFDICNRGLQHLGVPRITSFSDNSKEAAAVAFVYDKLRKAELRRNVWRFATRRAALYPIQTPAAGTASLSSASSMPTMLLIPVVWSAAVNYGSGTMVQDSNGTVWISTSNNNIGQTPGSSAAWDVYFGSLCVQPYDQTGGTSYYVGDLVYIANGIGNNQIYVSQANNNSPSPQAGSAWSPTQAYNTGNVVFDFQGLYWRSLIDLNYNAVPGIYTYWVSGTDTPIGTLAIGGDGHVYQSLASGNATHNPSGNANPAYWFQTPYVIGSFELWNANTAYNKGQVIAAVDGNVYESLIASNFGNSPLSGSAWKATGQKNPWTSAFADDTAGSTWRTLNGAQIVGLNVNYPLGAGPSTQTLTRNAFRLPNGFLREAPQDPKSGSTSFLGAPSGLMYTDWEYEGNYIISRMATPILLRFVADITQVTAMDPMFCEGLAARIAIECCEELTQSAEKLRTCIGLYKQFMDEARTVNGIETGAVEPPEDDWVTCRI